jgi:hypothetical protein
LYGTVTLANAAGGGPSGVTGVPSDGSQSVPDFQLTKITQAEQKAKMDAEQAKLMAELKARMQKVEAEQAQMRKAMENGVAPRKER